MRGFAWIPAVFVALAAATGHAAAPATGSRTVAIFPLDAPKTVPLEQRETTEDLIRSEASKWLTPLGWIVLTNETQLKLLADNGITPEQLVEACNKSCVLATAQELKVRLFFSGALRYLEDEDAYVLFVRLYDGVDGRILASTAELQGKSVAATRRAFSAESEPFFVQALSVLDPEWKKQYDAKFAEKEREERRRRDDGDDGEGRRDGFAKRNPIIDLGGRLVVRGGLGGLSGVLGGGVELHSDSFAFGVGYGRYLSGGVTWKPLRITRDLFGGPYIDAHFATRLGASKADRGGGLTAGWDFRPLRWVSLKAGAGVGWSTLWEDSGRARPLVVDLAGGLVF